MAAWIKWAFCRLMFELPAPNLGRGAQWGKAVSGYFAWDSGASGLVWILLTQRKGFLFTPIQQLQNGRNKTSRHVMYIEILKFASCSFKQKCRSSPLVVPVDGAAPILAQAAGALCCSHLPSSGLFLLQRITNTLWQSLRLPTAFWMKNEEQTGSIHSEEPIYTESSIKFQMEK